MKASRDRGECKSIIARNAETVLLAQKYFELYRGTEYVSPWRDKAKLSLYHWDALKDQMIGMKKAEIEYIEEYMDEAEFWEYLVFLKYGQFSAFAVAVS